MCDYLCLCLFFVEVFDSLLSCLRVMVNLTHRNMEAATTLGMVGGLQVLMGCFLAHGIDEIGNYPDSTSELLVSFCCF